MFVVATAGHVDHGKSTLVRALTGMEPDRWAEERRRGMTIDLGFAWTMLPSGGTIAFVDVPGFVPNMLAGVEAGPGRADRGGRRRCRAGCRSPPSTWPRWTRWACRTACSR
ncbi:GTP-binding protein [Micromonospora sp. BRA006-A]|nr:GTP-binding protein [Micromonospora sp. BRA006-A]